MDGSSGGVVDLGDYFARPPLSLRTHKPIDPIFFLHLLPTLRDDLRPVIRLSAVFPLISSFILRSLFRF